MKKVILLFFLISFAGFAQPKIPTLKYWANDYTNTLNNSQLNQLNARLKTYQDTTSNQVVILMIPTLDGYPLEEYSYDVAAKNKIGTKGNDNGILFLVVKDDRKLRLEVGYGLEPVVPDALASSIIRNVVAPYFRKGDYYAGINAGISAVVSAAAGEFKGQPKQHRGKKPVSGIISFLIFFLFIIFSFLRRGRRGRGGFIYFGGTGGGFGGGSFGGSSGGGFGGFSGGGGSFGGGGASGGW